MKTIKLEFKNQQGIDRDFELTFEIRILGLLTDILDIKINEIDMKNQDHLNTLIYSAYINNEIYHKSKEPEIGIVDFINDLNQLPNNLISKLSKAIEFFGNTVQSEGEELVKNLEKK